MPAPSWSSVNVALWLKGFITWPWNSKDIDIVIGCLKKYQYWYLYFFWILWAPTVFCEYCHLTDRFYCPSGRAIVWKASINIQNLSNWVPIPLLAWYWFQFGRVDPKEYFDFSSLFICRRMSIFGFTKESRDRRQRDANSTTMMLIVVIAVFLAVEIPLSVISALHTISSRWIYKCTKIFLRYFGDIPIYLEYQNCQNC